MLEIVYRDAALVAIHKPSGLLVHRSNLDRHATRFAVQLLRDQIGQPVYPAHRLDRGASGLLLFALDSAVLQRLTFAFAGGAVGKTYLALVRGHPPQDGLIDHALRRIHEEGMEPGAPQPARTAYRRLAAVELPYAVDRYPRSRYALLELKPENGRRHQLRRHLKHIAHPIIGDATYGKGRHNRFFAQHFGVHRLLLACTELALTHPVSGLPLLLKTPLAAEFSALLESLGMDRR